MKVRVVCFAVVLIVVAASSAALAGWTVTNIHPSGAVQSVARGISGGKPVGTVTTSDGQSQAALWSGSATDFVNLHPAGYMFSDANGACSSRQVGTVSFFDGDPEGGGMTSRAVVWNGTAGDYTILHPEGYLMSASYAIWGNQIAGSASKTCPNGLLRTYACWWPDGAASWVDLAPAGYINDSKALAVHDGWQAGYVTDSTWTQHAALWNGTAGSFVDLNPDWYSISMATGVYGGRQVGWASEWMETPSQAMLWSGTPGSAVNLTPAGYSGGRANGIWGDYQVGSAFSETAEHAGLWRGTAESWLDLHGLLGPDYTGSEAKSIEQIGDELWITGSARRGPGSEAVVWHYTPDPVPEPGGLMALGSGLFGMVGLVVRKRIR